MTIHHSNHQIINY